MKVLLIRDNLLSENQKEQLVKKNVVFKTIPFEEFKSFQESSNSFDFEFIVGATELSTLNFDKFPELKFIQLISAGYDYLKLRKFHEKDVRVFNASGVYSIPISEWVIGLILADYKQLTHFYSSFKKTEWNPIYNLRELTSKKVLIYGTGSIGKEIAKRLIVFNCEIDGVNSDGRKVTHFNKCFSLEEAKVIIDEYDILIFALPSNKYTKKYVNMNFLSKLKEDTVIINVGRGDLIDEDELLIFLNQTSLDVRFYLDVVNSEPLNRNSKLWQNSKIFISPHISFTSDKHKDRLQAIIFSNISSVIDRLDYINELKGA